jgi:hypothetical protein
MIAFHGDPKIKAKYLRRVRAHVKADELIRGTGYKNGRGCAVGCTLNKYDHAAYETELGVPQILAKLEDVLFERMPETDAMKWPTRFLLAIRPGADLSKVWMRFAAWLMADVATFAGTQLSKEACINVGKAYERQIAGEQIDSREWYQLRESADATATAAAAAAGGGVAAATAAAATAAAAFSADAAFSAADADAAATAATYAAEYAASYAATAAAYVADEAAAFSRPRYYLKMADKLIEIMRDQ